MSRSNAWLLGVTVSFLLLLTILPPFVRSSKIPSFQTSESWNAIARKSRGRIGRRGFERPGVETGVSPLSLHKKGVKNRIWDHVNELKRKLEIEEIERMEDMVFSTEVLVEPLQSLSITPYLPDCQALERLHASMNGPSSWANISQDCCSMDGVTCNAESGRVVGLTLTSKSLTGQFNESLCELSALGSINVMYNAEFHGSLPTCISDLTELTELYFDATAISFDFPQSMSELLKLGILRYMYSYAEGTISSVIFNISSITQLNFRYPLKTLNLLIPDDLTAMSNIQKIYFTSANLLNGGFPSSLLTLETLTELGLEGTGMVGSIPKGNRWSNLRFLYLDSNSISGSLPDDLGNMVNLENLHVTNNMLSGSIPKNITKLQKLTSLRLGMNQLSGSLDFLSQLVNLRFAYLYENFFEGTLPNDIGRLSSLKTLDASLNLLEGIVPDSLSNVTTLTSLGLSQNRLKGSLPNLCRMTKLAYVWLYENDFDSNLDPCIGDLTSMVGFEVSGNRLEGELPPSFSKLTSMQYFGVEDNIISGNTDDIVSKWPIVHHLYLDRNNFTGDFETSFCNLVHLRVLSIESNRYGGILPFCIGELVKLQVLDVARNNFYGALPQSLSNLTLVQLLDMSHNQFWDAHLVNEMVGFFDYVSFSHNKIEYFPWDMLTKRADDEAVHVLDISNNNITEPLPSNTLMTYTAFLDVSHNPIGGDFPFLYDCQSLDKGHNLVHLDVSYTNIGLPQKARRACDVRSLVFLYASNSLMSGNALSLVCDSFPGIQVLDLAKNGLEGDIVALRDLYSLSSVSLKGNPLLRSSEKVAGSDLFEPSDVLHHSPDEPYQCYNVRGKEEAFTLDVDDSCFEYELCFCDSSYYGTPPNCKPCPLTAVCPGLIGTTNDPYVIRQTSGMMFATTGYWASPPYTPKEQSVGKYPSHFLPCAGNGDDITCRPHLSEYEKTCEDGYSDRLCSKCESGYFSSSLGCTKCPTGAIKWVILSLVVCALLAILVTAFLFGEESSGFLKILVFYVQIMAGIDFPMVNAVQHLMRANGEFSNIRFLGPECFIDGWEFIDHYYLNLAMPLLSCVTILLIFLVGIVFASKRGSCREWRVKCFRALVFLIYIGYMGTTSEILRPLACEEDPGLHERFLVSVPYQKCEPTIQFISVIAVIFYVVMLPIIVTYLAYRHRKTRVYTLLHLSYRSDFKFWELIITGRRILFSISVMLIGIRSMFMVLYTMGLFLGTIVIQALCNPYHTRQENTMETVTLVVAAITFSVSMESAVPEVRGIDGTKWCISIVYIVTLVYLVVSFLKNSRVGKWVGKRFTRGMKQGSAMLHDDSFEMESVMEQKLIESSSE